MERIRTAKKTNNSNRICNHSLRWIHPCHRACKPSEWGAPLPLESTESSLYPAGNEYVWLLNSGGEIWSVSDGGDWSIVISYKINTPHQFGAFGQTGATLLIADVFSLEDNKLIISS